MDMDKYNLSFETEHWECGDGCCDGDIATVTVNSIEIGKYGDLSHTELNGINKFIETLNQNDENLTLSFKAEVDDDDFLGDTIYLNDTRITDSIWASEVYSDILNQLKLSYRYLFQDCDWDIWDKEKRVVLVVESDNFIDNSK